MSAPTWTPLAIAALLIPLLTALPPTGTPAAAAAELVLTGDAGVAVEIDGVACGRLPLDAPIPLTRGTHLVAGRLHGALDFRREVRILDDDDIVHVRLDLQPLRRREGVAYSLLLAGLGQRYAGRPKFGWLLTLTETGGALTALLAEMRFQNARDDYLLVQDEYDRAVSGAEIERLRGLVESKYADMEDAGSLRSTGLKLAVGAAVLSVLDVLLRFPSLEAGAGADLARFPIDVGPTRAAATCAGSAIPGHDVPRSAVAGGVPTAWDAGLHVGLRFRF